MPALPIAPNLSTSLANATGHLLNWLACFLDAVMVSSRPHVIARLVSAKQYGQARMPKLSRPTLVATANLSLSMAAPHISSSANKYQVSRPPASPQAAPTTALIAAIAILFANAAVLTVSMVKLTMPTMMSSRSNTPTLSKQRVQ